jgi:HEAT repeat protein
LASPSAAEREQAGAALAAIGARNFYQPVLALLADPDPSVQRTAVQAAAAMRSPELVPALVYRLARRETAQAAAEALAAYGAGTERLLAKVLANPAEDPEVRRNAPRALGSLASPEAASVLLQHLDDPDAALRRQVDLALTRLARLHPEVPIERERVRRACLVELERAYRALAAADALGLDPDPAHSSRPGDARATARHLLAWALRERVDQAAERACRLLSVLLPGADLDLVQANLRDASAGRRAIALEILDTVLDRRLKRRLVPLLDGRSREAKLREGAAFFAVPRLDGPSWLQALLGDESPWIAAAALGFAAAEGLPVPGSGLEALLGHPAPYVREAAFLATLRLAPEGERLAAARRLAEDPYPPLRGRAATFARAAEATVRKASA